MWAEGTANVQDCVIQDDQIQDIPGLGIQVMPRGEATVTSTTIRRCTAGLFVEGKAIIGKGCSITACTESRVTAWKTEDGPGEVTVEEGADLVCEGNDTSNQAWHGNYVSEDGDTIKGVAEEKIKSI